METLWYDIRHGVRALRQAPMVSAAIIATLALAIGSNTAIFSVLNATVLRPLPFGDPSRLVWITSVRPERADAPFSLPEFLDYRRETETLAGLAAFANWSANLSGDGAAERLQGIRISANGFELLGVSATHGRLLTPADDDANASRVALISTGLWRRRFGASPNVLGQRLRLNAESYAVIGVLPASLPLPIRDIDVAVPLAPDRDPWRNVRTSVNFLRFVGRLGAGTTEPAAASELGGIAARLRERYPVEYANKLSVRVTPLQDALLGEHRRTLLLLFGAVAVVLAVAGANLLNVLLLRAVSRQREMAVRAALGASPRRLVRQFLTETSLLVLAGGVGGVLLGFWGVKALVRFGPASIPRLSEAAIDLNVLVFTGAVSGLLALALGVVPALQAGGALADTLRSGRGAAAGARRQRRIRSGFVAIEMASALVLLVGGGLMVQSLVRLQAVDLGFTPRGVFVARVSLPRVAYTTPAQLAAFSDRLTALLAQQPGVTGVGAVSVAPFSGLVGTINYSVVGAAPAAPGSNPEALIRVVTPGYFETIGVHLVKGRRFTDLDRAGALPVIMVNQALADAVAAGGDPIGMQLRIDDNDQGPRATEIVGVIANLKQSGVERAAGAEVYLPMDQVHPDAVVWLANNQFWMVRMSGDPRGFDGSFRHALREADADAAASHTGDFQEYVSGSLAARRFNTALMLLFAVAAALLAGIGLYTVVSYSIGQRSGEIAVRMALGATPGSLYVLVAREGFIPVAIGWALGALVTLAAGRLLSGMLYDVTPSQPSVVVGATLTLLAIAVGAVFGPARRAAAVNSLRALRSE